MDPEKAPQTQLGDDVLPHTEVPHPDAAQSAGQGVVTEAHGSHDAGHGSVVLIDPGLSTHTHRRADTDPRLARRAERQVAGLFTLSALATVGFVVAFFAIRPDTITKVGYSTWALGGLLGLSLFCLGAGAVHWAKKLMPDEEQVQQRHALRSTDADRAAVVSSFQDGVEASGIGRRSIIRRSLLGAAGLLAVPPIVLLRDLGPLPGRKLYTTLWKKGSRIITDPGGNPVKPEDIPINGVVHVLPEGALGEETSIAERGKASVLLIRLRPEDIKVQQGEGWDYQGIVAYSKVCTHVGCPVGLYEQTTHHLLCPCHQSTFDVANAATVVFGPAARPLPQLAITVDSDGYLVARQGFTQPVGPSFWERG